MKLVVKTKVIARTRDARYVEWAERHYVLKLCSMDFFDVMQIEKQVHQWACKNEKHQLNFHETVEEWYVEPELTNGY